MADDAPATTVLLYDAAGVGIYPKGRRPLFKATHNAVILEMIPQGAGAQASLTVLDSASEISGYQPSIDPESQQGAVTAYTKVILSKLLPYVDAALTVAAGTWTVQATAINIPNSEVVTVSGTINQGNAGAQAWPVDVSDRAGRAVGAITSPDGGLTTLGATTDLPAATTVIGRLQQLLLRLPLALGRGTMAQSLAVAVASDQAAIPTTQVAAATGGATHGKRRDLAAVVQAIKAGAGTLYGVEVVNSGAVPAFVQLFDAAAGGVILGTATPDLELEVAAGATVSLALPPVGVAFATAISAASTTTEGGAVGSAAGVELFAQYL